MRKLTPRARKCAASPNPYGPAPMITTGRSAFMRTVGGISYRRSRSSTKSQSILYDLTGWRSIVFGDNCFFVLELWYLRTLTFPPPHSQPVYRSTCGFNDLLQLGEDQF